MLKISNLNVKLGLQWLVLIALIYFCSITTLKTLFIALNKHEMLLVFINYKSIFAVVDLLVILILVFAFILYTINKMYWLVLSSILLFILILFLNYFGILASDSKENLRLLFALRIILILFHSASIFISDARKSIPLLIWAILISVFIIVYGNLINSDNYNMLSLVFVFVGILPLVFVFLIFNEMKFTKTNPTQTSEILDQS